MILKLKELFDLYTGRNIDKSKFTADGTPYIVGASNIRNGIIQTSVYVDEAAIRNPGIAVRGDLIVSTVGTVGKIGILDLERAVLSKHVCALRPKKSLDLIYLIAMLTAALCQKLKDVGEGAGGFSNKIDPAELLDIEFDVAPENDQRYLVLTLVRFAIIQVAMHLDHITSKDVGATVGTLSNLTANARKALRSHSAHTDSLFEKLSETCIDSADDSPDNPFNLLREEQHRIQNLLKII